MLNLDGFDNTWLATNDLKSAKSNISIYPNPSQQYLNINNAIGKRLTFFNLQGQEENIKRVSENKFDVSQLKPGIYFVEINNGKQKAVKKILITE